MKLDSIVTVLLEAETIEGDSLTALLTGAKTEPATAEQKPGEPSAPQEGNEPQKPVSPPKPGLAWEAQSHLKEDPDRELRALDRAPNATLKSTLGPACAVGPCLTHEEAFDLRCSARWWKAISS